MFSSLLILLAAQLLGMVSPGPTTVLMLRNGAHGGRRYGLATAIGVTTSSAVHILASAIGLAELLARSQHLGTGIRWLGAAYLTYLGAKILGARTRDRQQPSERTAVSYGGNEPKLGWRQGFFTNLFNPKVTLVYLALFGQLADAAAPRWAFYLLASLMITQSLVYWSVFACLTTSTPFRRLWSAWSRWVDWAFGLVLITFGVRLLLAA